MRVKVSEFRMRNKGKVNDLRLGEGMRALEHTLDDVERRFGVSRVSF